MNAHKVILLNAIIIFLSSNSYGQHFIAGEVIDSRTKEPLAFVNIIFNNNEHSGTVTDIDGKFLLSSEAPVASLTFSYVGYRKANVNLDSLIDKDWLTIELESIPLEIREVIVRAGENPANRIVRKVIENRAVNNPERISSFRYTSYNKFIYDLEPRDTPDSDSIQKEMNRTLKGGHMFIMESVTERKFIQPDLSNETILGTKVSGFKYPSFAPLATSIQPFSFYDEIIPIFDIDYLNPVSEGSLKRYHFNIEDTLFQVQDTIFILSFRPRSDKNFEGLKGLLYISTNKYAIQNVIAEPFKKGLIDVRIQQKYQFIDNIQWFPEQLNFELILRQYPSKEIGMSVKGKSYIKNVELFADLDRKNFSPESIQMEDSAGERDSLFWKNYRNIPLSNREKTTYQVIDSIGTKYKFNALLRFFEKATLARIPVKFIDIDISETFVYNQYEGFRPGIGAYTNEKISGFMSAGGFFGYGLKDHQWKYGAEFILNIDREREIEIRGQHQYTMVEAGKTELDFFGNNYFNFRDFLAYQMDKIKQNSISVGFRAVKYARINLSLYHTMVDPQYNYEFQDEEQDTLTSYTYSDVRIRLRYAYKEKTVSSLNQRVSMGTKYPVLYICYSRGIKDFFNSEFTYNKVEARIEDTFHFKNLGETRIRIDGGFTDRPLPYGLLFTGEGSFSTNWPVLIKNYFQTMAPYEFLSDRYVNFHFSHSFGSLLFQTKRFKPQITVYQSIGLGTLSNPRSHLMVEFKTKERGFYESGLQIDNIIKVNYFNVAYLGFGAGAYYRYGPYACSNIKDNLAVRFSLTVTTK